MPITPFIGVRISWLIVDRKSLLALVAASARSLAVPSSVFAWERASVRSSTRASRFFRYPCRSSVIRLNEAVNTPISSREDTGSA